jgi:hypothetical protein
MVSRDYWYLSSIFILLLAIIASGSFAWYGIYRTYSWGSVFSFMFAAGVLTYGPLLAAICGLVSYLKNGRKIKSLLILIVCIVVAVVPKTYLEIVKIQREKQHQAMLESLSPTQRLFYLVQDLHEEKNQKEFIENLNEGANINATDQYGRPLFIKVVDRALRARGYLRDIFIDFMIKHGAYVNIQDPDGSTALHHAARKHDVEIVEQLLKYGADPTMVTKDGETPLDLANKELRADMPELTRQEFNRTVSLLELSLKNRQTLNSSTK